ncbi:hypothetical protein SDC9_115845 [bioreactor metagenome]|uniref:HNH nuclease domain-containing protein n=1 Tax=bioreactor metagenome TaxID=1076179 RepID=A0A645BU07_9ZZZZ
MARFPEVYQDTRWPPARRECIRRANGLCQQCARRGKVKAGREVDHIIELTAKNKSDPMIAYGQDNLQYLCTDCHNEKHDRSIGLQKYLTPPGVISEE